MTRAVFSLHSFFAHASRAEWREDLVGPDACASGQGQRVECDCSDGARCRKGESTQAFTQPFRSDRQQISGDPSERNASWMSARLSYRTRRRRN
jgi:hypothetical protein